MEIADYIVADDRQLARRVVEGDAEAFGYLFDRYRDALMRLFVQRLNNPEDADDLIQETAVKVWVHIHRYNPDYTFGQWIYTVARNTFIDYVRKRQEELSLDESFAAPVSTAPTPEESVILSQQRRQIDETIARLPGQYRTLVRLRFFDELSYEEIAERLSLPLGTVKTQIHRARERMCRLLNTNKN